MEIRDLRDREFRIAVWKKLNEIKKNQKDNSMNLEI